MFFPTSLACASKAFALALLTLIPGTRGSKKGQGEERQAPPPPKRQKAAKAKAQPMQLPSDDLEDDYEQEKEPAAAAKGDFDMKLGSMMMMLAAACDDAGISVDVSVPLGWELCKEDMEEEKPRLTVSKLSDKIQEKAARKQQTAASLAGQAGGFGVAAAAPGVGAGLGVGRGAAVGAGQQAGAAAEVFRATKKKVRAMAGSRKVIVPQHDASHLAGR
ncbi:hypothetical protein OEZ85_002199 [Tetradesmus obliquus]|uniref:Uncharacterized protein n=1 Tax=Tetradesmus obliquus TaxID=3088 RepID=A0ABY8U540_TETOB|nr:hypothetical protein OEZ85_002199 [Tetradesmus obliquus]